MDPTESEFFSKAGDDEARPRWTIPLLAVVVAIGAISAWYILVRPPAAPLEPKVEPPPVVTAPTPVRPTFDAAASLEKPEKPPPPPKDFDK